MSAEGGLGTTVGSEDDNTFSLREESPVDPPPGSPRTGAEGRMPNAEYDCGSAGTPFKVVAKVVGGWLGRVMSEADCTVIGG